MVINARMIQSMISESGMRMMASAMRYPKRQNAGPGPTASMRDRFMRDYHITSGSIDASVIAAT